MRRLAFLVLPALALVACKTTTASRGDMLREAKVGCERKSGADCFQAGALNAEEGHAARAAKLYAKGCALRHAASCDALASLPPPDRQAALEDACAGGDGVSCVRVADVIAKEAGPAKARPEWERLCRASAGLARTTSARDVRAAGNACQRLAGALARGEGGAADPVRATRLETLSTLLRAEALFRFDREEDARASALGAQAGDAELARFERESAIAKTVRDELLASGASAGKTNVGGLPLTPLERAYGEPPMPAASVAPLDASTCRETGDPIACAIAAAPLEKTDPNGALDLHLAGCTKKPDQCWSLVAYAEHLFEKKEAVRAAQALQKGCELKAPMACARLGTELEIGERGLAQDLPKALKAHEKACDLGVVRACASAASMHEDGRGTYKNPVKGKALRLRAEADPAGAAKPAVAASAGDEEACRKSSDAARCAVAAAAAQDVDAVKAEELHRVGCNANKDTCGLWTFALDRFKKDDAGRGARILEQGCKDGALTACLVLADVSQNGFRGVVRADAKAAESFQRACDLGSGHACRVLAARTRAGVGAPKNPAKADELKDRAFKADEEADKARGGTGEAGERWAVLANEQRSRGPFLAELDAARASLEATGEAAEARAKARNERVQSRGRAALPAVPPEAEKESVAREESIKKTAGAVFAAR